MPSAVHIAAVELPFEALIKDLSVSIPLLGAAFAIITLTICAIGWGVAKAGNSQLATRFLGGVGVSLAAALLCASAAGLVALVQGWAPLAN